MKYFIVFTLLLFGGSFYGQEQIVQDTFYSAKLSDVLNTLESKYDIKISFDPEELKSVHISKVLNHSSISDALQELLAGFPYEIKEVKSNYFTVVPLGKKWHLQGIIVDENKEPLPFVKVRIMNSTSGVITDFDGKFSFYYRSESPPEVELSYVGYQKKIIPHDQLGKDPIEMEVLITPIKMHVVEYLTQGVNLSADISHITLMPKIIGNVPGTTNPDVFQMVQNVPGINSASSSISDLQIRGGTADQNQLIWDGIPIYHPGHFSGMISSVNPNMIQSATIYRGVYNPFYGGRTSGLIDLKAPKFTLKKTQAGVEMDMIQTNAHLKVPLGRKMGVILSARRSTVDYWNSPTYKKYAERVYQETEISNSGIYTVEPDFEDDDDAIPEEIEVSNKFNFYDLNGKIYYRPNWNNYLSSSFIHIQNRLIYSTQNINTNELDYNEIASSNSGLGFELNHNWNDNFRTDISINHSNYTYEYINELNYDSTQIINERTNKFNGINHTTISINNKLMLNQHHRIDGGYQLINNGVEYSLSIIEEEDSLSILGSIEGMNNVFHLNHEFTNAFWKSKVGVRASHQSSTNQFYLEPRIYQMFQLNEHLKFQTSFGMQNQFISQVDELEAVQLGLSNRIWIMANEEDFPVMKSSIASTGFIYTINNWLFELDGYYKTMNDIVNFSESPQLSSGFLRGDATAVGVDIMIKKRWNNFRTWLSYSLSDVMYEFEDLYNNPFPAPYHQKHNLNWANTFQWKQFTFSSTFKIASGKRYSPVSGIQTYTFGEPGEEEYEYELIIDNPNSKSLPIFHQLDLTINYSFPKSEVAKWKGTIGASCFNLYNRTNVLSRIYELEVHEDDNGDPVFETYAVDRYYLSFTPNLLFRMEF